MYLVGDGEVLAVDDEEVSIFFNLEVNRHLSCS